MKFIIVLACVVASAIAAPGSWRIVGGDNAAEGQFPYQISLRSSGSHSCGGSILDETTILCAAHCVDGASASRLTVRVGNNKLNEQTEEYKVAKLIPHKKYDAWQIQNDISLIKLASPIKFRPGVVEPVKLRQTNIEVEDVVLSGWGTTSLGGRVPNDLQYINLKTISVADCKAQQGSNIIDSEVCTLTKANEGACHGDSGGPLVDANKEQIGVVSWGTPCARGKPDVFTRVYSFLSWIEENRG